MDVGLRWETDRGTIGSDSRLTFDTYPAPSALLLKNLRLEKFQATFAGLTRFPGGRSLP